MKLTDDQLHTLRHMLGINDPYARVAKPYRNYAAVEPGKAEYLELERLGMVEKVTCGGVFSTYDFFRCTDRGKDAAIASFRSIQKGKPQRVYRRFLSVRDCCPDLTFKEFLTDGFFAEIRRQA